MALQKLFLVSSHIWVSKMRLLAQSMDCILPNSPWTKVSFLEGPLFMRPLHWNSCPGRSQEAERSSENSLQWLYEKTFKMPSLQTLSCAWWCAKSSFLPSDWEADSNDAQALWHFQPSPRLEVINLKENQHNKHYLTLVFGFWITAYLTNFGSYLIIVYLNQRYGTAPLL